MNVGSIPQSAVHPILFIGLPTHVYCTDQLVTRPDLDKAANSMA